MLVLAINTASQESAVALLSADAVLGEETWPSNANESQKVLPAIEQLLEENSKKWADLTGVFVVRGPGPYTSLRVGITMANAIAWKLDIPMKTADVFDVWESRLTKEAQKRDHIIAIGGGRDKYLLKGDKEPRVLESIEALGKPCYGEIPDTYSLKKQVKKGFGEAVLGLDLENLDAMKMVEPLYTRPPDITTPKKTD